ncbi:MAG: SCP2 sterol-binding domain-containing protein [Promethearchaeota archaeon]
MPEIKISPPRDLISIALENILSYRKDDKFYALIKDWNKTIVINVKEFYPVTVIFQEDTINFKIGDTKKADFKVTMGVHTMLDLAYGRTGPIRAVLSRKLKIKGLLKLGILLKFQNILLKSMKMVVAEPNINYFELEKTTK